MLKERESVLEKLSIVFQVVLTIACYFIAKWIIHEFSKANQNDYQYEIISFIIAPLWLVILDQANLGRIDRFKMYSTLFVEYLTAIILGNVLLYTAIVVLDLDLVSRAFLAVFAILNLIVLYSFKFILSAIMKFFRRKGLNSRSILIIADKESNYFIDQLITTKDWGYKIWGIMSDDQYITTRYKEKLKILPYEPELSKVIDEKGIDEVIYCKSFFDQNEIQKFIYTCAEVGIVFRMQSQLLSCVKMQSTMSFLNQMPFLTFRNTPDNYLALKVKILLDLIFSLLILILLSPIMLVIALFIKLDGGSVMFKQKRMGLHGRHFMCLKFRTMVANADQIQATLLDKNEQEGPVFKIKNDPRVTKIGRFLRKTSLDELPQFINVLRGEMSIVGPRPPIPSEVKQYKRWQTRRLSMRPGITCIWQVSGRNKIPFEQWMKLDMQYIDNWSLKLDLIILLKTVKVVLSGDGQ
jgi:exopolysaccharide biosynthesis polyprenyl glycosylphosphotransferase